MKPLHRSYDDIIGLPRPISPRRTRMSPLGRAAQFAPFAALTGFDAEIDETYHLNVQRSEQTGLHYEAPDITLPDFDPDWNYQINA